MNKRAICISDEWSSEYQTTYQQANNSELERNEHGGRVTPLNQLG